MWPSRDTLIPSIKGRITRQERENAARDHSRRGSKSWRACARDRQRLSSRSLQKTPFRKCWITPSRTSRPNSAILVIAAFENYQSPLASARRGTIRRAGKLSVDIDIPDSAAGNAVLSAAEDSGVIARPFLSRGVGLRHRRRYGDIQRSQDSGAFDKQHRSKNRAGPLPRLSRRPSSWWSAREGGTGGGCKDFIKSTAIALAGDGTLSQIAAIAKLRTGVQVSLKPNSKRK